MTHDKRRCHRIKITLDAVLRTSKEDSSPTLGVIENISGIGICVMSARIFEVGQSLYVDFGVSEDKKVTIETKIVRRQQVVYYGKSLNEYGLKITDNMKEGEREFLKFFVKEFLKLKKSGEDTPA